MIKTDTAEDEHIKIIIRIPIVTLPAQLSWDLGVKNRLRYPKMSLFSYNLLLIDNLVNEYLKRILVKIPVL